MSDPYASLTPYELRIDNSEDYENAQNDQDVDEELNLSKSDRIKKCIERSDKKRLRKLGREKDGFISNDLRRIVWPLVMNADLNEKIPDVPKSFEHYHNSKIVWSDVHSDLIRYDEEFDKFGEESWRDQLMLLICRFLVKHGRFFQYFQGYHNICLVLLTVLGEKLAFHTLNRVSQCFFAPFLKRKEVSDNEIRKYLDRIFIIIKEEDLGLSEFLEAVEYDGHNLTSWTSLWFTSSVRNYKNIVRLFDLFLVSDPLMVIYLSAVIMLHKKDDILSLSLSNKEVCKYIDEIWDREDEIPFEDLIYNARSLMGKYTPQKVTNVSTSDSWTYLFTMPTTIYEENPVYAIVRRHLADLTLETDPYSSLTYFEILRDEKDSSKVQSDQKEEEPGLSKSERIQRCIEGSDIKGLRKLGRQKGGFISNELRKTVWPLVARVDPNESIPELSDERLANFEASLEYTATHGAEVFGEKIEDLRSYFWVCQDLSEPFLYRFQGTDEDEYHRNQLKRLATQLMLKIPDFQFFHGYLCLCAVFLNVLDERMTFHIMRSITNSHLEMYSLGDENFAEHLQAQFKKILRILEGEKPNLRKFLEASGSEVVDQYWLVRWGASRVKEFSNIARLFDLFLTSDPEMPTYFFVAILLFYGNKILKLECSRVRVSVFLNVEIWKQEGEFPFEDLIYNARWLLLKYQRQGLPPYIPFDSRELKFYRLEQEKIRAEEERYFSQGDQFMTYGSIVLVVAIIFYFVHKLFFSD